MLLRPSSVVNPLARFHQLDEDDLSKLAMEANAAGIELVLHHPRLTDAHVEMIVKNVNVTPRILEMIGNDRRFTRSYDIKHALARHPRAPRHIALRFVKHLYLSHLLKLLDDHQAPPGLKRHAESLLDQRMPQITLGERLTMAKTGGPGVLRVVRHVMDLEVLKALLRNPRLTSGDVVSIIQNPRAPKGIFEEIAALPRWQAEYHVRLALARNPQAPLAVALGGLSSLLAKDLRDIARNDSVRRLVRVSAERVLEARSEAARTHERRLPAV